MVQLKPVRVDRRFTEGIVEGACFVKVGLPEVEGSLSWNSGSEDTLRSVGEMGRGERDEKEAKMCEGSEMMIQAM
jgi:hypothetical protein